MAIRFAAAAGQIDVHLCRRLGRKRHDGVEVPLPLCEKAQQLLHAFRLGRVTGEVLRLVRIAFQVEEVPLAYLPSNAVRVRVKAVGDLELEEAGRAAGR